MREITMLGGALALAACVTAPAPGDQADPGDPADPMLGVCDGQAAQAMLGQMASAEIGQRLLAATGAAQLRWAPPRSAMTMDYRADRLTVEYDDAMNITRIACG